MKRPYPLILKLGATLPALAARRGDFEAWIAAGMGAARSEVDVISPPNGDPLPDPATLTGVVISGSHAMVTDRAPWSEALAAWLRRAVAHGLPILGICYGHQLLAYALGGEVGDNPRGREFGTIRAALTEAARQDPLLHGLGDALDVQTSHMQSVLRLPNGARVLAFSEMDPHLAFALGDRVWGVQFHPEFDADVVRTYIEAERATLLDEGRDPDRLMAKTVETPGANLLLRRFAHTFAAGSADGSADNPAGGVGIRAAPV